MPASSAARVTVQKVNTPRPWRRWRPPRAELVRARRDLERTSIRVPYAGIVRTKVADIGQFVSPGVRLGVVFATDIAEVRLPLTDGDLAFVDLPGARDMGNGGDATPGPDVRLSAVRRRVGRLSGAARIVRSEGVVDANSRVTYAVAEVVDPYGLAKRRAAAAGWHLRFSASIAGSGARDLLRVPRKIVRGSNQLIFVDADGHESQFAASISFVLTQISPTSAPARRRASSVVVTVIETPVNGMAVRTRIDGRGLLMAADDERHGGIIAWFAANHVAANLLMFLIIVAGPDVGAVDSQGDESRNRAEHSRRAACRTSVQRRKRSKKVSSSRSRRRSRTCRASSAFVRRHSKAPAESSIEVDAGCRPRSGQRRDQDPRRCDLDVPGTGREAGHLPAGNSTIHVVMVAIHGDLDATR